MNTLFIGTHKGLLLVEGSEKKTHLWPECAVTSLACGKSGEIVVGLGAQGVGISQDGGRTWRRSVPLGTAVVSVAVDPHGSGRMYAGCQPPRVLVSDDTGVTWDLLQDFADLPGTQDWEIPVRDFNKKEVSESAGEGSAIWSLVLDPCRVGRIIAGVEVGGLVVSEDGGSNWTVGLVGDTPDTHTICLHPEDSSLSLISTGFSRFTDKPGVFSYSETGGVYRSNDMMATFSSVWPLDPEPQYARAMCIDRRAPYAATVGVRSSYVQKSNPKGLRRAQLKQSRDGGVTWVNIGDGPFASYGEEFSAVIPAPSAANNVFVGTEGGRVFHVDAAVLEWTFVIDAGAGITALLCA